MSKKISFKFVVKLSKPEDKDLDEMRLSAVGKDPDEAFNRLLAQPQVKEFMKGKEIVSAECTGFEEYEEADPADYVITPSQQKEEHWVVADKVNNLVVIFRNKAYKDTAKITFLDDKVTEPHAQAVIIRKIGEWLALYHLDKL